MAESKGAVTDAEAAKVQQEASASMLQVPITPRVVVQAVVPRTIEGHSAGHSAVDMASPSYPTPMPSHTQPVQVGTRGSMAQGVGAWMPSAHDKAQPRGGMERWEQERALLQRHSAVGATVEALAAASAAAHSLTSPEARREGWTRLREEWRGRSHSSPRRPSPPSFTVPPREEPRPGVQPASQPSRAVYTVEHFCQDVPCEVLNLLLLVQIIR